MRHLLRAALFIVLTASPCFAQDWVEFVDKPQHFGINLPKPPTVRDIMYAGDNKENLPAKQYSVTDGANRYLVTVVNYAGVQNVTTVRGAIAWAAWNLRKRPGQVTYDGYAQVDRIEGHQIQITNSDKTRTYAGIYLHAKRLFIIEATVPADAAPPLEFQQTLMILDDNGQQVRYDIDADGTRTRVR